MSILKPKCYKETNLYELKKGAKGKVCLGDSDTTKFIEKDGRQCFDVFERCKKCKHYLENKKNVIHVNEVS